MFGFHSRKVSIGLEITSSEIGLAEVTMSGSGVSVSSLGRVDVPSGVICESYDSPNIADPRVFRETLKDLLQRAASNGARRTGVGLPDSIFRVQTFEFDDFPGRADERERLIRWRFEKSTAFDSSETVLRYQVVRQQERGVTLLACIAKRSVVKQYEDALLELGLEVWVVGPSSFHALNFFFPFMAEKGGGFAMASVSRRALTAIVVERGGPRFYRFKEIKSGSSDDFRGRLARELEDSLHFYQHQDRSQPSEIDRLYLTGDRDQLDGLSSSIEGTTSLAVEVLSPGAVLPFRPGSEERAVLSSAAAAALAAGRA